MKNVVYTVIGGMIVGMLATIIFVPLFGWLTMFLWNHVIPQVFVGIPALTFWQGCWLYWLCTLLLKTSITTSK